MEKDFTIVFLTEQKSIFYDFLKFLTKTRSQENPCLISSEEHFCLIKINTITLIICDPLTNYDLIDYSSKLVELHPHFIPIILFVSNQNLEDFNKSLTHVTAVLDPIDMWQNNWRLISHIRNVWQLPELQSFFNKTSICDILQMIGNNKWIAIVRIQGILKNKKIKGCIMFNREIQCAWSTNYEGQQAVLELLSLEEGILDVIKNLHSTIKNVYCSLEEILIMHAINTDIG